MVGAANLLAKWGFIKPTDRSRTIEGFIAKGLQAVEDVVGKFEGVAERSELVFHPCGIENDTPLFGLRVERPHVVRIVHLLSKLAGHEVLEPGAEGQTMSQWFGLNLSGPGVFGPWFYSDLVRMSCWGGEEDEAVVVKENGAEHSGHVYTKAQFISDTAPWIFEAQPKNHDFWLSHLRAFDGALAYNFDRFLKAREVVHGRLTLDVMDLVAAEAVFFAWSDGHRVSDIYDEYINNEVNSGMTVEWAWLLRIEQLSDFGMLRAACQYHHAAAKLADYITKEYPA